MCDLNGHVFFGDELAKNKYFMASILEYNELVLTSAEVLRLTPDFLKPYVCFSSFGANVKSNFVLQLGWKVFQRSPRCPSQGL